MPLDELRAALTQFVSFARALQGDEKSEAQSFLDHFFRALVHEGLIEAGATFEFRVANKPSSPQLGFVVAGSAIPATDPKAARNSPICSGRTASSSR